MHVCTIVACNYLPQARVLAKSFRAHHPEGRFTVLLLDRAETGHSTATRDLFEVLRVDELTGDTSDLRRMAAFYDVLEYSTALKPWLLRTLLNRGSSTVTYLDPDIQVFTTITELDRLAVEHELVLTPHVTAPMKRDGKKTAEFTILRSGMFNLGFISVGERSIPFLDFWSERVRRDCVVQPHRMLFVDQRWVDFAPCAFDAAIVRDPTFNVAYWNLSHRIVSRTPDGYRVTGRPLRFFHFSGYSPRARHLLSKHQMPNPRVLLSEHPVIRTICDEYADRLIDNGFPMDPSEEPEYGLSRLGNSLPLDRYVRAAYRHAVLRADAGMGEYPPDPFDPKLAKEVTRWLNEAEDGGLRPGRLSRYLSEVYDQRPDVQAVFPDARGADHLQYLEWVRAEAELGRVERQYVPARETSTSGIPLLAQAPSWAPPDRLRPGFTVIGYLKAELGVGEGGRLVARAIREARIPCVTVSISGTPSRQEHPHRTDTVAVYDCDTNVVAVNADRLSELRAEIGEVAFRGRYTIGQWAWELEEFPARWARAFDLVDEVWANSEFARAAISSATEKKVFSCPPAIVAPQVPANVGRRELGLPEDRFVYLFALDLFSVLERKNPLGLIDAFTKAFPKQHSADPILVVKVINGDQRVGDLERIKLAVSALDRSDVLIIDRYMSAQEQAALMSTAQCYASLHRSEGFGLTLAESMALGKPVIATGYSGNLDFMSGDTAFLVRWDEGVVPGGCEPYEQGARWAEPDLDHAAHLMRFVFENPSEALRVGEQGKQYVRAEHGLAARGAFIRRRFDAIQSERARIMSQAVDAGQTGASIGGDALVHLARERPALDAPARRAPKATRFYRRLVLRAQRHHDDHQRRVDVALAQAFSGLERGIQGQIAELRELFGTVANRDAVDRAFDDVRRIIGGVRESSSDGLKAQRAELQQLREVIAAMRGEAAHVDAVRAIEGLQQDLQKRVVALQESSSELRSVPYMSDPSKLLTKDAKGRPAIGYRSEGNESVGLETYASFEDVFRGPEEFIRRRQEIYLTVLGEHGPVLDAGCGRGEMLDLLRVARVSALGIDSDPSMVDRCRSKGHDVKLVDAIEYLMTQKSETVGAVFSAQLIEHLPYEALMAFLREGYRVLRPGGIWISETVNPHAVPAFKTFWTDLTHQSPIFPEVAATLCRIAGFEEAVVMFPNGTGELEVDRWREGEYAVVAKKREGFGSSSENGTGADSASEGDVARGERTQGRV